MIKTEEDVEKTENHSGTLVDNPCFVSVNFILFKCKIVHNVHANSGQKQANKTVYENEIMTD